MPAVTAVYFLNNFPDSSTLIVKTTGRCDEYLYYFVIFAHELITSQCS